MTSKILRRDFVMGLGGAVAVGLAAWSYFGPTGYPKTPFDDLLNQIIDRAPAITLGKAMPKASSTTLSEKLRQPGFALRKRSREDAAAGRVTEIKGWVVPETLALYAQLAAAV